jgi:CHAT domain-containing protein
MAAALLWPPAALCLKPILGIEDHSAAVLDQIAEARQELSAVETNHPGNTTEVAEALMTLVQRERIAYKITPQTHQMAERSLQVAEAAVGRESGLYARALANKAKLEYAEDRPAVARPLAEEALEIARRAAPESLALAEAADALGKVCHWLWDLPCALRAEQEALAAVRVAPGDNQLYLASMLQDLAGIQMDRQDFAAEKAAMKEAIELVDQQTRPDPDLASLESYISVYLVRQGEIGEARVHLKKTLDLCNLLYGPDSIQAAYPWMALAEAAHSAGQLEESLKDYRQTLALMRRWYGPTHARTAMNEAAEAEVLYEMGRKKEGLEEALRAHSNVRDFVTLAMRVLPERQALAVIDQQSGLLDLALTILAEEPEPDTAAVYQEQIRSRALVAEEMARRQPSLNRESDPEVQRLIEELNRERKEVLSLSSAGSGQQENYAQAVVRMEKTERALAERSLVYRAAQRTESVDLTDLRRHIPADAALVSYVRYYRYRGLDKGSMPAYQSSYLAFVLHPGRDDIRVFDLGEAKSIDALVDKLRSSAESEAHAGGLGALRNERLYRGAGEELRKRIWDPLRGEIGLARLALVVADGELNLIPFASLPEGNGYLVEYGPVIHMLTSERDLIPAADLERKTGLLAIGSPRFGLTGHSNAPAQLRGSAGGCESIQQMAFDPLPGTAKELSDIGTAWQRWNRSEDSVSFSGDQATGDRFLQEASKHRVLHVATHAILMDSRCGNGNPLLRSGLIFAGANRGGESSVVTAQQIAALDLRGVEWAVLSACNTGNGELKDGEGVLGLERAFRVAGVHSVVMTLWPVDDQMTRGFMHALYTERLSRRASTADSVWKATQAMLATRRSTGKSTHPWYWAGFVGAGDWE